MRNSPAIFLFWMNIANLSKDFPIAFLEKDDRVTVRFSLKKLFSCYVNNHLHRYALNVELMTKKLNPARFRSWFDICDGWNT